MPQELIQEYIGEVCNIMLFNESFGVQGRIVEVKENWVKFEEKKRTRIINCDMIKYISIEKKKK